MGRFILFMLTMSLFNSCEFVEMDVYEISQFESEMADSTTFTEVECRRRFYKAMEDKCSEYGIFGEIIEGPSGFGAGGEVENEVLGHGMSKVPISGMCKIMAIALDYEKLSNVWSKNTYMIHTHGVIQDILLKRSLDSHFGSVIEEDYSILGWKTGSNGGLTNLMLASTCSELEGSVMVAVMSRNYMPDTEANNRSLAMKYLLDIGKALYLDREADISELRAAMLSQHVKNALVVLCPPFPRKMYDWDILNDPYHFLFSYGGGDTLINPMSMIKVLVAEVVLDNVADVNKYVTITQNDIVAATGGTGAIFTAGQKVTYMDLLCAMLMPSSNQAGYVLARRVGQLLLERENVRDVKRK